MKSGQQPRLEVGMIYYQLFFIVLNTCIFAACQTLIAEDFAGPSFHPLPGMNSETDEQSVSENLSKGPLLFLGAVSCSSSNCHGSFKSTAPLSSLSYTIWQRHDPHAQAYRTLTSERSQRIAEKLKLESPAEKSAVCLNCHAAPQSGYEISESISNETNLEFVSNGVSCEACHGQAVKWLEPHRSYAWNSSLWNVSRKNETGFKQLKSTVIRAETCASCHIGSAGRDVNHDLIAAGHPRLLFEYTSYMDLYAQQAAHWDIARDKKRSDGINSNQAADHALNSWAIGQLVCSSHVQKLLHQRLENSKAVWPELAEYSCYSCHHDLSRSESPAPNWRQAASDPKKGSIARAEFYSLFDRVILESTGLDTDIDSLSKLELLNTQVDQMKPQHRDQMLELSASVSDQLDLRIQQYLSEPKNLVELRKNVLSDLLKQEHLQSIQSWDVATQYFLALSQLQTESFDSQQHSQSLMALQTIRANLAFPTLQLDHPENQQTHLINSPQWDSPHPLLIIRHELKSLR
ncbi:multiheme c-type cytochrome [Rubinisphaera sp.]|uniref:multiheme c-type cytochrome n=1 Tax=Rubinisphaera sp. TaxID=2024857 RepID=UPI00260136A4|nr:multiheme c-type cytochrome [Rubinisphaera sp.]